MKNRFPGLGYNTIRCKLISQCVETNEGQKRFEYKKEKEINVVERETELGIMKRFVNNNYAWFSEQCGNYYKYKNSLA